MASIDETKDIIKNTPISSIISFYHPITKRGVNYEGICPFHSDTKPSMKVNDQKGIYKCFACGAAGDSIKFVQDFENIEFVEAIKDIGQKLGLVVEENQKKKANPKMEMGLRVLTSAHKLYKKFALETKPQAFYDFLKKRNLNMGSVEDFGLGYAPKNSQLRKYLLSIKDEKDRNAALKVAKEIGIVRQGQDNRGDYDFFRDRVIFPIWDHFGNVRGFSSRAVFEDQKPKYLNSGESFIFDKGNILYGFNIAKPHIRDKNSVLIVEGNMDAVVLHQFGFKNTVATMGVALSENSAKLLSSITPNIFLAMDSDDAGFKGMTRINQLFLAQGILPKYIDFTPAKDPDEYLNQFGRLKLLELVEDAKSFTDVLISKEIKENDNETTDQKLMTLDKVFEILSPLAEGLIAKEKCIEASKSLGLQSSSQDISDAYSTFLSNKSKTQGRIFKSHGPEKVEETQKVRPKKETSQQQLSISKAQKQVIGQLIMHPECLNHDQIPEILDFIDNNEVKRLINWLKTIFLEIDDSDYVSILKTKLDEDLNQELKEVIAKSLFDFDLLKLNEKVSQKLVEDLLLNLKKEKYKLERSRLISLQKEAKDQTENMKILEEISKLDENFSRTK